jgi:hypothetical protein
MRWFCSRLFRWRGASVKLASMMLDEASGFELEVDGFEEFAAALAAILFEALLEVPDRFGVVAQPVELLQHEHLEHEHRVEGWLASFAPVASRVAGELFGQRAEALPGDKLA